MRRFPAKFLGNAGVRQRRRGQIFREVRFRPQGPQVIERGVGGDAPRPRLESSRRIEAGVAAIDAPEGFDGEVFGSGGIADDADNPAIDVALMPAKQGLEGVKVFAYGERGTRVTGLFPMLSKIADCHG